MFKFKKTKSGRSALIFAFLAALLLYVFYFNGTVERTSEEIYALFFIGFIFLIIGLLITMNFFFILGVFHQRYIKNHSKLIPISTLAVVFFVLAMLISVLISMITEVYSPKTIIINLFITYVPLLFSGCFQKWALTKQYKYTL